MSAAAISFYVTGGTLRQDALSYVERRADKQLYEGLIRGEFCYVLTSRQMGKSSPMVHTASRLREDGVAVALLDLTGIGQQLTVEQWYDGLLRQVGLSLGLEDELEEFWGASARLSPLQRWMGALREVVLARCPGQVVIFIDEIDVVKSLPFSTDEFFAAIRQCYNLRTQKPEFERLSFCLLGVASPSELIRDTGMTPFNIGRRIELTDFTPAEATPLRIGLVIGEVGASGRPAAQAQRLWERILYWTNGHPHLTQRLCQAVAGDGSVRGAAGVDRLCEALFLSQTGPEKEDNLLFVRERLLRSGADVASLLDLYSRVRGRRRVPPDDTSQLVSLLRLSGIVRVTDGRLRVRNRIYARVFDRRWITQHMPDAELRRQRAAFRRGLARAAALSTAIVAIMAGLTLDALRQREESRRALARMDVSNGTRLVDEGDLFGALPWFAEALTLDQGTPEREEIDRVRLAAVLQQCPKLSQLWLHATAEPFLEFSADGRRVVAAVDDRSARIWDVITGAPISAPLRHQGKILHAAFSPDGRRVVTASTDRTAQVWDAATGAPVSPPLRHRDPVQYATFSADGHSVLTAAGSRARAWNSATGTPITPPLPPHGHIQCAAFSPDGRRILTVSGEQYQTPYEWDVRTGHPMARPLQPRGYFLHAAFSADCRRILTIWQDRAQVWDAATGAPVSPPLQHRRVSYAAFSRDGRRVVTVGGDQTAQVWDVASGAPITPRLRHRGGVTDAEFSPDGRRVVTASFDGIARVWDTTTGVPVTPPLPHEGPVLRATFSADGRRVATTSSDDTTRVWDVAAGQPVTPPLRHRDTVSSAAFSPDGRRTLTVSGDEAEVWDSTSGEPVAPLLRHPGHVTHAAFSPDGRRIVTASWDRTARVWDAASGVPVLPPLQHQSPVWDAGFSPDGKRIVTGTYDETARVWDSASGMPITPPLQRPDKALDAGFRPGRRIAVLDAAFSPDSRHFATVSMHGIQIRDAATGAPVTPLLQAGAGQEDVAFSPDGRHLLARSFDRVELWDAIGAHYPWSKHLEFLGGPFLKLSERVWHAAFSPDGRRVVTACADQTARVWDVQTGPVTPPLQHQGEVRYAAFSPDGRCIVTASDDQTARVWDAGTGEPMTPPLRHYGKVLQAEFSPDGRHVVTASEDQTARVWDLPLDDRPCPDLQRLAELLSGRQIDSNSGSVRLEPTDLLRWAVYTDWQALRGKYPGSFSASPQQVLAWHQREAESAEREREWAAALLHLDTLIQANPKAGSFLSERAGVHAELGHWRKAEADFTAALALRAEDPGLWSDLALAHLGRGNLSAYRRTCAAMLDRFGGTDDPEVANTVSRTLTLVPYAAPGPARPLGLAETALRFGYRWTLGAALYRAGRLDQAMKRLTDTGAAQGAESRGSGRLFLSMCQARLGHPAEARKWLQAAVRWIERATKRKPAGGAPLAWDERLELNLLRGEAEALLGQTASGQKPLLGTRN